jgi:hypothetical protein
MHYFEIDFVQGQRLGVWGLNVAHTHTHTHSSHIITQEMSSGMCDAARERERRAGFACAQSFLKCTMASNYLDARHSSFAILSSRLNG